MKYTLWIMCLLAVVVSMAACEPKIVSFEASPRKLCTGQSTTLSWKVNGKAVLLADPPLAGTGAVSSTGSRVFAPAEKTIFTIRAMRSGKDAFARQEVVTLATEEEKQIVIKTEPDGAGGLVAADTLPSAAWDDFLRIDTISGHSHRPLRVLHEGREVTLPADGSESDQMKGLKVSGRWEIHAGLQPGEVMGDPNHAPPDRLRVLIHLSCGKLRIKPCRIRI